MTEKDLEIQELMIKNAELKARVKALENPWEPWCDARYELPQDGETVLVVAYGSPADGIRYPDTYFLAYYDYYEGWIIDKFPKWENPNVSYWTPLPEQPEKMDADAILNWGVNQ